MFKFVISIILASILEVIPDLIYELLEDYFDKKYLITILNYTIGFFICIVIFYLLFIDIFNVWLFFLCLLLVFLFYSLGLLIVLDINDNMSDVSIYKKIKLSIKNNFSNLSYLSSLFSLIVIGGQLLLILLTRQSMLFFKKNNYGFAYIVLLLILVIFFGLNMYIIFKIFL